MLRLLCCVLLYISLSSSQVVPYGATPVPLPRTVSPGQFTSSTLPTTIPPGVPNSFPFGPSPRPLVPGYNNPYYNPTAGPAIPILTYSNEQAGGGTYSFSFSTADGKQVQENGYLKDTYIDNAGEPQGTQVVQGSYSYIAPDGTPVQVSYVADENGFRPSGVHISADGKGIPPLPLPAIVDGQKDGRIYDPRNRYDPYNRYNALNNRYDPLYNRNDPLYNRNDPLYNRNDPLYNRNDRLRNRYDPLYNRNDLYNNRYDPLYNRNDPYNRNQYNYPFNRPYDARYPYDPARYNNAFNPYRPTGVNKTDKKKI